MTRVTKLKILKLGSKINYKRFIHRSTRFYLWILYFYCLYSKKFKMLQSLISIRYDLIKKVLLYSQYEVSRTHVRYNPSVRPKYVNDTTPYYIISQSIKVSLVWQWKYCDPWTALFVFSSTAEAAAALWTRSKSCFIT